MRNIGKELTLNSYFGESKRYHFFLVKSDLDFYPFALQLNKQLSCSLSYSGAFSPCEDSLSENSLKAVFCFLSSPIHETNKGNIFVIENKTTNYNQEFFDKSKQTDKYGLHPLSLFKEYYYLFGNNSPVFWKFPNKMISPVKESYDYVIIVSHDKKSETVGNLLNLIKNSRLYSVTDIYEDVKPYINNNRTEEQPAKKRGKRKDAIDFLLELCQIVEITKNDFKIECVEKLLGKIHEIPIENQTFPFPFKMPLQIEEKYISLLSKDSTFE